MALLHGSWIHRSLEPWGAQPSATQEWSNDDSIFFLWGETWRATAPVAASPEILPHPMGMSLAELIVALQGLLQSGAMDLPTEVKSALEEMGQSTKRRKSTPPSTKVQWEKRGIGVLSRWLEDGIMPLHSATVAEDADEICLFPVTVEGLCLDATVATAFLLALPLVPDLSDEDRWLGDDLLFWSHLTRWSLDLLVRSKVLPAIAPLGQTEASAYWQPLLDSAIDQTRFRQMSEQMPLICRCYFSSANYAGPPVLEQPLETSVLLRASLQQLVDRQVRQRMESPEYLDGLKTLRDKEMTAWLSALGSPTGRFKVQGTERDRLLNLFQDWTQPIQSVLSQSRPFRPVFQLMPPLPPSQTWTVSYGLQATDDLSCWISAEVLWKTTGDRLMLKGRTLEQPQETLLVGLGLASRVYPAIEESLKTARPVQHNLTPLQAYEFLKTGAWRLEDSGFGVLMPPSLSNREGWANRLGLQVRAEVPTKGKTAALNLSSLLNFKWELTIGGQRLSKGEFDYLVSQNSPLVEINGEWVELRPQDVRAAEAFFANRQNQSGLSLQDALRLSAGDTLTIDKLPIVKFEATGALEELMDVLSGNQTVESIEQPEAFLGTLRPYQSRGAGWLSFLERWNLGACLADDMGLGKTIQLIAYLLHLKAQKRWKGPILLVCPTSVLGNWEREIKRFGPTLKTKLHHGTGRAQKKDFAKLATQYDVILTSYPLIHRDEAALIQVDWFGIVLDEAQNIKNPEARQSQTVRRLQAKCRIALTGTPLENRLAELWSILDFLNPGYLGSRAFFQKRFAMPIERYGDTASLQTLRSLVQPFILRRVKTDRDIIQDLPEKQEMTVFCPLTPEQAALYEQTVQEALTAVEAAEGIQRRGLILASLTKLKQICNHPAQFLKENALQESPQRSGKLKRLEEMLEEALAEGDRALIFTQFAEMGKLLQGYLQQVLNRETLLLYGGTSKNQREAMIDRFQNDPQGPRLFILSLKAGGVGLNLTRANHVFHFDRWWNPAVENQATDRVFRIGQTRNVQVHKFVCGGTLEERIHEMLESKKALAEQVVGAGENWLTSMDTDQLRQLLLLDRTAVIDEES
jgi:SNF2 family DNA or RNA helicase